MDEEMIRTIFELFLKEQKIKYTQRDGVYSVDFGKHFGAVFGQKIKCAIQKTVAEKNNCLHLSKNSFVMSKIISLYAERPIVFSVTIPSKKDHISALQDQIDELAEKDHSGISADYKTEEMDISFTLIMALATIAYAASKDSLFCTVLADRSGKIPDVVNSEQLLHIDFKEMPPQKLDFSATIAHAKEIVSKNLKPIIEEKERIHDDFVARELKLKEEHFYQLVREEEAKLGRTQEKILLNKEAAIFARSFKGGYGHHVAKKAEEHKLLEKSADVSAAKKKLEDEHRHELDQIRAMRCQTHVDFVGLGTVQMKTFVLHFTNGKNYVYVPDLALLRKI